MLALKTSAPYAIIDSFPTGYSFCRNPSHLSSSFLVSQGQKTMPPERFRINSGTWLLRGSFANRYSFVKLGMGAPRTCNDIGDVYAFVLRPIQALRYVEVIFNCSKHLSIFPISLSATVHEQVSLRFCSYASRTLP
ncbi:hypothetical protein L1887_32489 [Cichorium endivia]|nr:hypothetical protein L1887_32489 [Cichorium endivia]